MTRLSDLELSNGPLLPETSTITICCFFQYLDMVDVTDKSDLNLMESDGVKLKLIYLITNVRGSEPPGSTAV